VQRQISEQLLEVARTPLGRSTAGLALVRQADAISLVRHNRLV
jgi:hypothetical protein